MTTYHSKQRAAGAGTTSAAAHVKSSHLPDNNRKTALPSAMNAHLPAVMTASNPKFRLPEFSSVKSTYTDKKLKIPEASFQAHVTRLLERMAAEKRLKSSDPVPVIIKKIFPSPGKLDEAEFNAALDISQRSVIYKSIADSHTTVEPKVDKPKLDKAMSEAEKLCNNAAKNAAGLTEVFGAQDKVAAGHYGKIEKKLSDVRKDMDKFLTTDYNLDDSEVGLGGYALFATQEIHLLTKVAQVTDPVKTKITVIHEAAHLADSSIDDQVYYTDSGFEAVPESEKIANAAHFEELPRRELKVSNFPGPLKPGVMKGGAAATREDIVRTLTGKHLRKAWDAAVDTFTLVRGVRKEAMAGNDKPFKDNQALLEEISKLEDLSIHEQAKKGRTVTDLDMVIAESIAHSYQALRRTVKGISFPAPGALTNDQLKDHLVAEAIKKENNLLKDPARDKKLTDWMVAHYRSLPSV
ncbi:hypothetical protein SAMN05444266_10945 [Chitinophaga jiangningensis]|uniref:Lysine-specific metallo-endopeptidase n=1 Tax=Chitinophaga jiangningensis TaxID=1419482 RepID=A0A1M7JW26_9BACT|nr:hypothetical protein [Chitinophaga jiangningensis]SHM57194.1 hypothetical protein SAMN05444266_10945 [Chitinophaga jiangningensis]